MVAGIGRLPGPWQRLAALSIGGLVWLWDILQQLGYLYDSPATPNPFWWLPTLAECAEADPVLQRLAASWDATKGKGRK